MTLVVALMVAVVAWEFGWPTNGVPHTGGPIQATTPVVTAGNGRIDVTTSVTSVADQRLRGWFFLAVPGAIEPWNHYSYKSSEIVQDLPAGQPTAFRWSEPIAIPDGVYQLTAWFHKSVGDGWVHALGGDLGLTPLTISGATTPFHQFNGDAVASFQSIDVTYDHANLTAMVKASGAVGVHQATLTWQLLPAGHPDATPVYVGISQPLAFGSNTTDAVVARLDDTLAIPVGAYDMEFVIDSGVPGSQPQRALYPAAVTQTDVSPYLRQAGQVGVYRLSVAAPPPDLQAGTVNRLNLSVTGGVAGTTCRMYWRLLLVGSQEITHGEGGSCDAPTVFLPPEIPSGAYTLEVKAVAANGESLLASDLITIPVGVTTP
ncbi:MAG: hypothetical protein ACYDAR_08735 [Thermomicrobiales bacterium]